MTSAFTHDPRITQIIFDETTRQGAHIDLIASENIVSPDVLQAQGSILTNKYAEGRAHRRYYGGCDEVDKIEDLAEERLKKLFGARYANVQPHSGSSANLAVFFALLTPGDTFMAMALDEGGHLTHGAPVNFSGKWFNPVHYRVDPGTQRIDMDALRAQALKVRPRLIIAGLSAYPRALDFQAFRSIADEVGAYLMVDMAHIAGLIATGLHPSPFPHAHVVTSTTHKTLRGPRGGIVLTNDADIAKKIHAAIFPGLQGGPLMHVIAAKAVAFGEALQPSFTVYMQHVLDNARAFAGALLEEGINLVTGGTDNHLLLLDLRALGISGQLAESLLETCGLIGNKNSVPGDTRPPLETSGLRLGTPAATTRGLQTNDFRMLGQRIGSVLKTAAAENVQHQKKHIALQNYPKTAALCASLKQEVATIAQAHPLPYAKQSLSCAS